MSRLPVHSMHLLKAAGLAVIATYASSGWAQTAASNDVYIVGFSEAPLATYRGEMKGLSAPPRKGEGRGRVDVKSPAAQAYVKALKDKQAEKMVGVRKAVGRNVEPVLSMQHAFNGVVLKLSADEAAALRGQPGVMLVEPYREDPLNTDVGPGHIGATSIWENGTGLPPGLVSGKGVPSSPGTKARGEGVVFGIIDSGVNFGSPSFAAVDMDGYRHVNPLGDGNYLGTCAPGGIDEGRCNAKLIGGWDFVCTLTPVCTTPGLREFPGFSDENGHGSHTASTSAGNKRQASFRGNDFEISGVAPRGNVIAYNACYTNAAGQGLCPNVSTLASINQAVADGVDVINYSISGGTLPWSQANSLAFLAATDAGVFVSASAGNAGPGANTLGHLEPWVATVAAAQHGRGGINQVLEVTGPGTPPAALQAVVLSPGANGVAQVADIPGTTPLVVSPGIDTASDGCVAFAAGQFAGAIAVVRRGTCSFTIKTNNAAAAGAIAVVIANNAAGTLTPSVPGTTVPAYAVLQTDGNALRDFAASNPGATAAIPLAAKVFANTPDALAAFSSRGPNPFDLLKPDITGPGVLILAAYAGPAPTGSEQIVNTISGTSMSSPHNAGAGGLLRQLYPSWTPSEIKSALMMTAAQTVLLEDQVTPAGPLAAGSGRIQVDMAAKAGLVLDETTANYLAANPASGGDTSKLNLANMAKTSCVGSCTFERTFRATRANQRNWDAHLEGLAGSVDRPQFNLGASGVGTLRVTVDTTGLPAGTWQFGTLVLTPRGDNGSPVLRLPIAVRP
jgi:Subtilase family/PA domain